MIAAARDDPAGERVVVMETKGEQLAGNHDTEYKRALLDTLTAAFGRTGGTGEQLDLAPQSFTFGAAVVVFDDLDAQFPALIRGGGNE